MIWVTDYFLQEGKYLPKSERVPEPVLDDEAFIASLSPSYLKYVVENRKYFVLLMFTDWITRAGLFVSILSPR